MIDLSAHLPQPGVAMVDPTTGNLSRAWWYYFQQLFTRTGGGTGGNYGPVAPVTLTGSPFTYTATGNGSLLVSGGGISRMRYTQDGTHWYSTGSFYGAFPISVGNKIEITYVSAPTVTFIPGA